MEAEGADESGLKEEWYKRALELRQKADPSQADWLEAALLLKDAAGAQIAPQASQGLDALASWAASGASVVANASRAAARGDDGTDRGEGSMDWAGEAGDDPLEWGYTGVEVAADGHLGALMELARATERGEGMPANALLAWRLMREAGARGHAGAQAEVGLRLATGALPAPDGGAALALRPPRWREAAVHLYFGAAGNDTLAQLALGYRHMQGLGVPRSCAAAVLYYQPVAEQVIELARRPSALPQIERMRLSAGGVPRMQPSREQQKLHFQWFADLGSPEAQRALGQLLSQGSLRDPAQALHYFRQAAEAGDADAMAHLGHMFANGAGVAPSNVSALEWFTAAAEHAHPSAQYGLGYLHLAGYGVEKDARKAFEFFTKAAEQGHVEAWFHLGVLHLRGWGTPASAAQALNYFSLAAKMGHLLAQYNLAMIHLSGSAAEKAGCMAALELLKRVAERGPWAALLQDAAAHWAAGDAPAALLAYLRGAEAGLELAQANAAWMLGRGLGAGGPAAQALALRLHQRAAGQGNVEALLQLGDSHWYGRGVARDWARAGQLYAAAAKFRNAQALFNLGIMHEFGAGLPRDMHLAKRHYDRALEAQPDARLPVQLALASLELHKWWDSVHPYLPRSLNWLWVRVYAIRDPGPTTQAVTEGDLAGSRDNIGLGLGLLERLLDSGLLGGRAGAPPGALGERGDLGPEHKDRASRRPNGEGGLVARHWVGEPSESLILLALCVGLGLVLWRRRSLRATQLAARRGGPATNVPAPRQLARDAAAAPVAAQYAAPAEAGAPAAVARQRTAVPLAAQPAAPVGADEPHFKKQATADPRRLLTDRSAYIEHLESELKRVSAACLTVHSFSERIESTETQAQLLEEKVLSVARLASNVQDQGEQRAFALAARLHKLELAHLERAPCQVIM
ncbi:hypothetical protein WJX81_000710 [Elliptochloris bilobata]|uniref:Uncharacterized protein n=1 Tax=Elliptochloris bilobata TaxID=381761 RepID=A0AAW1S944_9CHLO